jgi:hypothetical protein
MEMTAAVSSAMAPASGRFARECITPLLLSKRRLDGPVLRIRHPSASAELPADGQAGRGAYSTRGSPLKRPAPARPMARGGAAALGGSVGGGGERPITLPFALGLGYFVGA